jgi:hypothetical protein
MKSSRAIIRVNVELVSDVSETVLLPSSWVDAMSVQETLTVIRSVVLVAEAFLGLITRLFQLSHQLQCLSLWGGLSDERTG